MKVCEKWLKTAYMMSIHGVCGMSRKQVRIGQVRTGQVLKCQARSDQVWASFGVVGGFSIDFQLFSAQLSWDSTEFDKSKPKYVIRH